MRVVGARDQCWKAERGSQKLLDRDDWRRNTEAPSRQMEKHPLPHIWARTHARTHACSRNQRRFPGRRCRSCDVRSFSTDLSAGRREHARRWCFPVILTLAPKSATWHENNMRSSRRQCLGLNWALQPWAEPSEASLCANKQEGVRLRGPTLLSPSALPSAPGNSTSTAATNEVHPRAKTQGCGAEERENCESVRGQLGCLR